MWRGQYLPLVFSDERVEFFAKRRITSKFQEWNVDIAPFMFRTVGGTVNGVKLEVSAAPIFKNGEEIILYLQRNKSGTGWKVTRGELGKVRL